MERSDRPCVVGLAERLESRRNSESPGTWPSAWSSSVASRMSAAPRVATENAALPTGSGGLAVTTTVSIAAEAPVAAMPRKKAESESERKIMADATTIAAFGQRGRIVFFRTENGNGNVTQRSFADAPRVCTMAKGIVRGSPTEQKRIAPGWAIRILAC